MKLLSVFVIIGIMATVAIAAPVLCSECLMGQMPITELLEKVRIQENKLNGPPEESKLDGSAIASILYSFAMEHEMMHRQSSIETIAAPKPYFDDLRKGKSIEEVFESARIAENRLRAENGQPPLLTLDEETKAKMIFGWAQKEDEKMNKLRLDALMKGFQGE
jgi:hypothetical protein